MTNPKEAYYQGAEPLLPELLDEFFKEAENPYSGMGCEDLRSLIRELDETVPQAAQRAGIYVDNWYDFDAVVCAFKDEPEICDMYCELVLIEDTFNGLGSDEECRCAGCKQYKLDNPGEMESWAVAYEAQA